MEVVNIRLIDHIVYCVPNLEDAVDQFASLTGIKPKIGGRHLTEGTKNALVNLGDKCYLELLAIDQKNDTIKSPRWMGIDLIDSPKITRWAIKSENLQEECRILQSFDPKMGQVKGGERKMTNGNLLKWDLAMPLSHPEIELAPFITDWSKSDVHPTDSMQEQCHLLSLELEHPSYQKYSTLISQLNLDIAVKEGRVPKISLTLETPNGTFTI